MKIIDLIIVFMILGFLPIRPVHGQESVNGLAGEKIFYTIKKLGVKIGDATLEFKGRGQKNGRDVVQIIFTATGPNFSDEEKIFVDPETFLPLWVERDLNIWGRKEKIVESYDLQSGRVSIKKTAGRKVSEDVLTKPGPIENIYGFIFRIRRKPQFQVGDSFEIKLPTRDMRFEIVRKENMKAGERTYPSFLLESAPQKYRVWFADDAVRIPLRIDGAVGIGNTSMILGDYEGPAQAPAQATGVR